MATGIVLTVVEKLYTGLHSDELRQICSMFGYESQLDELSVTVSTIKSVLLDAESKHQELSHEGRDYIERLKEAVYDVDDLLDEFNTMVEKEKYKKGGKIVKKVRQFISGSNQFFVAFNMSRDIKSLRDKLDKIAKDHRQFGLSDVYVPLKRRDETFSYASDDNIIGREVDKENIVGMLLGDSESRNGVGDNVSFVSIIGIGGLGKTALAQLVYNDHRVEMAFELRLWVCVSKDFDLKNIFGQMLERNGSKIEGLQTDVRKLINGKRCLLVLDDVWSENPHEWDKLKPFLNLGRKGSRIVVTSRSKNVANVLDKYLMYELKGLSEKNSWDLFMKFAFRKDKEPMDSGHHLFDISKEIWKKCANVPLAIRVVGSMLYDQDESKWLSLQTANLMKMGQGEEGILPILKFSYYELSPTLKSCFSVCALFPKDFVIEKELLVRLWLVQGCLDQPCRSKEDVGKEHFLNLLHRCFLQDVKEDMYGEIISCKMHDLIHDLAQEVAGKETLMLDCHASEFDRRNRHLSLSADGCTLVGSHSSQWTKMKRLRTFLRVSENPHLFSDSVESDVTAICSHLRRLRVLDLHNFDFNTLPSKVGSLSHLRYLDLSKNRNLKVLPNSITQLLNLQVLSLDDTYVRELPPDMRKLVNLRHLSLRNCNLKHMPAGLDNLTCLRTLTMFVVGNQTSDQREIGKLRDLKALVNLTWKLSIIFPWEFSCDGTNYQEVELIRAMHLKKLSIEFGGDTGNAFVQEILLGSLQPHTKLMVFKMTEYNGFRLPTWAESITTSLPYLVKIHLTGVDRLGVMPSLCQLRHLKILRLEDFPNPEFMENDVVVGSSDDGGLFFPSLENLELVHFPKLNGWWREEKSRVVGEASTSSMVVPSFPRLSELALLGCPSLITFPPCPNLINIRCHEALSSLRNETRVPSNPTMNPALHLKTGRIDNVGALDWLFRVPLRRIHTLNIFCFQGERLIAVERHVYTIQELYVYLCQNLISMSGLLEHITSLQILDIKECENLELERDEDRATMMQWRSLKTLSTLNLTRLPKLVNLPKGFLYLSGLQVLRIHNCDNLEALPEWLNYLSSLQSLTIWGCNKLKSLPEAIAHMPTLITLNLLWCGEDLRKRCQEPNGEDWPKVCHIPDLVLLRFFGPFGSEPHLTSDDDAVSPENERSSLGRRGCCHF